MENEEIFKILLNNKIKFVLIGGTALMGYGSNRSTLDTDIAVKTIDIDKIIKLFYKTKLILVIGVDKNEYPIFAKNLADAFNFTGISKWGFLKFLSNDLEIDIIYEFPFPFMQLYTQASEIKIDNIKIKIANLKHLKIMKEKSIKTRDDTEKIEIDKIDLKFINKKLKDVRKT